MIACFQSLEHCVLRVVLRVTATVVSTFSCQMNGHVDGQREIGILIANKGRCDIFERMKLRFFEVHWCSLVPI
jgi:hypothetical protein